MTDLPAYPHPPGDRLDYTYDFRPLLDEGETITAHQVTGQLVTISNVVAGDGIVTCWVDQPTSTLALITFAITTSAGREHTREVRLDVRRL